MSLFKALGCICLAGGAIAFPSLRNMIPNGFRVACPPGGEGCREGDVAAGQPDLVCNGIGHRTCAGATMPLNPFGISMQRHNYTWSAALCREDSDGDGLTNGEELGDPCCLWQPYDTPSSYMAAFPATHPGAADSVVLDYVRPTECGALAPTASAPPMNQFNLWEEQRVAEMHIDNFAIPARRTTYVDIALNFPDDSRELFHIVFAEAIVTNSKNLHHYVIRGCSQKWPADKVGKEVTRLEAASCNLGLGGWAPGKAILSTPSWLGHPVGSGVGIVAFVVNVHYDNPANEEGRVSNDGMRIFYTPTLRNETVKDFPIMRLSVNPSMGIPAGRARHFITRSCRVQVQDSLGRPAKFHVAFVKYHAHLLGREMFTELTQGNETIDLGSEPIWHFDDQYMKNVIPMNITLQTGDHVQSSCIASSIGREATTIIGAETTDEMCWAGFEGWPGDIEVGCSGHIWMGELNASEPGLGLAARHPESAAADIWDGSSLGSGGTVLKGGRQVSFKICPNHVTCPSRMSTSANTAPNTGHMPAILLMPLMMRVGLTRP